MEIKRVNYIIVFLDPSRFGRKHSYALGKLSGKASLEHNLKDLGIDLSEESRKKVLNKIIHLGDQKKTVTREDIPFIIADVLKLPEHKKIEIKHIVITSGKGISPVCSMILIYKDKDYNVTGTGDGGYDAFMNAIKNWSRQIKLSLPKLINYEVRIPPGGETSALVECKIIWQRKKDKPLITKGVHPDQVLAAVQATERLLNLIL